MPSLVTPEADAQPDLTIRVILSSEDDHWAALLPEYTISGRGRTPTDAAINACELFADYLDACAADGLDLQSARRPLPLKWRIELEARLAFARLLPKRKRRTLQERRPVGSSPIAC